MCPICGKKERALHRCDQKDLDAIDAADRNSGDDDEIEKKVKLPSYSSRLAAGFAMIEGDYES